MKQAILLFSGISIGAVAHVNTTFAALPLSFNAQLQARSSPGASVTAFNLPADATIDSSAAIDANARIAFFAVMPDNSGSGASYISAIWSGTGGLGNFVYSDHAYSDSGPCMNASGAFAFTQLARFLPNFMSIYVTGTHGIDTGSVNTIQIVRPCVNTAGVIDFMADGTIYATTDGTHVTTYATAGAGSPYASLGPPAFNDAGVMTGLVVASANSSQHEIRAFAGDGSSNRIIANHATDAASAYTSLDPSVSENSSGQVAVAATRTDGHRVVLRSDGITTVEIANADSSGVIRDVGTWQPTINDDGLVAFIARDSSGEAIYVGDGIGLRRVVGEGDAMQTDLGAARLGPVNAGDPVFHSVPAINVHGDITFIADLQAGNNAANQWGRGVFIAHALGDSIFANGFDSAPD